jgi:hypothetical protein
MRFADVVSIRDEALAWVAGRLIPGSVCAYQLQGGGNVGARRWRVAGFYSEPVNGGRVVFEALYEPGEPECLLRIYREHPLEYLSTTVAQDRTTDAHLTAARAFVDAVADTPLRDVVAEQERRRKSFPPEVVEDIGTAPYPIPPPVE